MPDIDTQLRQYLDSTVERINAEDVLIGARVTNQLHRWDIRARRPLRMALAAATLVTLAVGAVVIGAWALGRTENRIAEVGPTPTAAQPLESAVWPVLLIAVGALAGAAVALTIRKRKGGSMETLERHTTDTEAPRNPNRGLIIALIVALLALAGLGTWVLFDKVIDTGIEADINALLDDYTANSNASDFQANVDLFLETGVFIDGEGDVIGRSEYVEYYENSEQTYGDFQAERLGDSVIIEDPSKRRYYVSVPMQIGIGVIPDFKGFSIFVLTETADGELKIVNHQWAPNSNHR